MIGHAIVAKSLALLQQATQLNPGEMTKEQFNQQIALEAVRRVQPNNAVAILVPLGVFALIAGCIWLVIWQRQSRIRASAEFHKQLLDKFGSGREFSEFLESQGGQRFLDELWSQGGGPKDRILAAVRAGVVLAVLGVGLFGLTWMRRGFLVPAVLAFSLGAGFLISAAISYRLSKQWPPNRELGAGSARIP